MSNGYDLAFFADTHIDYRAKTKTNSQGVNIRVQDGYDALKEVLTQILNWSDPSGKQIDGILIAGDLFHTSTPSIRGIATVQFLFREVAKRGIKIYTLAGNHDATDIRSNLAAVAAIHDPDRGIYALWDPYTRWELADGLLVHAVSHHGLQPDEAPTVEPVYGAINIFTTHGAALDPKNKTLMRCENSPREQMIPVELITDDSFNAKLLGHYHSRYAVGGESLNTWYSGSTLRRGFSDEPGERGWMHVHISPDGETTFTPHNIHQRPQFDLPEINAEGKLFKNVMEELEINIKRTLETEEPPIVRQRIINMSKAVRDGLSAEADTINDLTKHMLMWQLEKISPEHSTPTEKTNMNLSLQTKGSNNIVDSFGDWIKSQTALVPDEYKETVTKDAETYLKRAREDSLKEDS